MNIALLQMELKEFDMDYNRKRAGEMIDEAMSSGKNPDIIVLPETWTAPFNLDEDPTVQVERYGETEEGKSMQMLCEYAKRYNVWIVAGTFPVKYSKYTDGRHRNTTFLINRNGEIVSDYSKVHLCSWVDEDVSFEHGTEVKPIDTELGKLGIIVCYDIRFPELARTHALLDADMLVVPSYFTTDLNHWRILLLARAIENQMFVIGCNSCNGGGRPGPVGHSMIIDPFGNIIAEADEHEQILYGTVDLSSIKTTRNEVTYLNDRRPQTYSKKILEPVSVLERD